MSNNPDEVGGNIMPSHWGRNRVSRVLGILGFIPVICPVRNSK
jgi:hypothetical protein